MATIIKEYGGLMTAIIGGIAGILLLTSLVGNWNEIGKSLAEGITGTTLENE